jgi:AAA+ ATPase superfamily predicted ATPase
MAAENPFRIHGVVTSPWFTDRARELERLLRAFHEPGSKLVVLGPRRMGKTSILVQALTRHQEQGGLGVLIDLSTATTLADAASRLLEAATVALGRKWKDAVNELVRGLGVSLALRPDPATGLILPSLDVRFRAEPAESQRKTFAQVLDVLEAMADKRDEPVAVVLDEFQDIARLGGENAEWHLRGTIQHHRRLSYVLAGSEAHLIGRMLEQDNALYGLADLLEVGPIDADHMARWIDDRLTGAGVRAAGCGARAIALAGPRTRDIVQVARRCYDNRRTGRKAVASDIDRAFDDVMVEQETLLAAIWSGLTAHQQNVLRAVAADREGLTTADSRRQFGLPSTGSATNTAAALVAAGHLLKPATSRTGFAFDNPFFRRWVELNTLADVGLLPDRELETQG